MPSCHALKVIAGLQASHENVRQLLKAFAPPKPTEICLNKSHVTCPFAYSKNIEMVHNLYILEIIMEPKNGGLEDYVPFQLGDS